MSSNLPRAASMRCTLPSGVSAPSTAAAGNMARHAVSPARSDWPAKSQHALASAAAAILLSSSLTLAPLPSLATDGAAIGKCLLSSCQVPLAKCVTNPTCVANLLCIQTCTNRPLEHASNTPSVAAAHVLPPRG